MNQWNRSLEMLERSKRTLAGGVSSNVRLSSPPHPLFFKRAEGAMIYDVDDNGYIDYLLGQGPMILGHSHPAVLDAVNAAMRQGQLYAGQHELEFLVAEKMVDLVPCAELCRFGLTGSDMVQTAMRLMRAVTGRTKVLRFEGHYHGWFDNVQISVAPAPDAAGPRERPNLVMGTLGQTESVLGDFVVLPWNDLALVEQLFAEMGGEIAGVMTEPMMCNTGAIPPEPGFLEGLRRLCDEHGALLYFDETITGFRLGLDGAQGRFGVTPDLASFAKAMAGGFANAALVGRGELMERLAKDVNHSGTFNSNVISMAASMAAIAELERNDGAIYKQMHSVGSALIDGIRAINERLDAGLHVQGIPPAFHLSFTDQDALKEYRDYAWGCDIERYSAFSVELLKRGVRVAGRGIWYLSAAHTEEHVEQTLEIVEEALTAVMA